jgi:hypothetical protein
MALLRKFDVILYKLKWTKSDTEIIGSSKTKTMMMMMTMTMTMTTTTTTTTV